MTTPSLATRYLGLSLPSPILAGSSGLTGSLEGVRACADAGAGAVVSKSRFGEQWEAFVAGQGGAGAIAYAHPEAAEYIGLYGRENAVQEHLDLVASASRALDVPVIASIHCVSPGAWTEFAARYQQAGAQALELNVFVPPTDPRRAGADLERLYVDLVRAVKQHVRIPVALKLSSHFTGLAHSLTLLGRHADGLVLFNRFARMDIDLDTLQVTRGNAMSHPDEALVPLRWIGLLAGRVDADLCASTGIHTGRDAAKQILAGATAVQVASALYQHSIPHLTTMLADLRAFMGRHGFTSLDDFRGRLSQERSKTPAAFERVQFMKLSVES